jgi:hypothetical protein
VTYSGYTSGQIVTSWPLSLRAVAISASVIAAPLPEWGSGTAVESSVVRT